MNLSNRKPDRLTVMRGEKSMKIDNYEDMEVYRLAIDLQQKIFVLTTKHSMF